MPFSHDPLFSKALADRVQAIQQHVDSLTAEELLNPDVSGKLQRLARSIQDSAGLHEDPAWEIPATDSHPQHVAQSIVPMSHLPRHGPFQRSAVRRRSSLSVTTLAHPPTQIVGSPTSHFLFTKEADAHTYIMDPRINTSRQSRGASLPGENFSISRSGSGVIRHQSSFGTGLMQQWPLSEETWIGSESGLAELPEGLEPVFIKPPRGMDSPSTPRSLSGSRSSRTIPKFCVTNALESFARGKAAPGAMPSYDGQCSLLGTWGHHQSKPIHELARKRRASASPVTQWPAPSLHHSMEEPGYATREQHDFRSSSGSSDAGERSAHRIPQVQRSFSAGSVQADTQIGGAVLHERSPNVLPVRRTRTVGNLRVQALTSSGLKSAGVDHMGASAPLARFESSDIQQPYEYDPSMLNTCPGGYEHQSTLLGPEFQLSMQLMTARLGDFKYRSMDEVVPDAWQLNHGCVSRNRSGDGRPGSACPSAMSTKAAQSAQLPNVPYRRLRSNLSRGLPLQQPQSVIAEEAAGDVLSTGVYQVPSHVADTDSPRPLMLWVLLGLSVVSVLLLLNTVVMLQAIIVMQHGNRHA